LPEHSLTFLAAAIAIVGGYLLGSIPFGLIAAKLGGAGDIRQIGSGNIGATNVLRTGRKDLAAITLIGDSGKGAVAAVIAWTFFGPQAAAIAGGAAFVGHLYPLWLGFKGGKGVATFFGVLLAIDVGAGLAAGATWLLMAAVMRMSSLASLTAAALAPLYAFVVPGAKDKYSAILLAIFMAILIFVRHRENIGRLLKNEEPRIGAKKPAAPPASEP
jgi:glycerol-3-phosphate acyltransferase PlsY